MDHEVPASLKGVELTTAISRVRVNKRRLD
jgi:hypothetical protein